MDKIVQESKHFVLVAQEQFFPTGSEGDLQFLNWLESYLKKGMEFASMLTNGNVLFLKKRAFEFPLLSMPQNIERTAGITQAEKVLFAALDAMMELTINPDSSPSTHVESVKIAKIYHDVMRHEAIRDLPEGD